MYSGSASKIAPTTTTLASFDKRLSGIDALVSGVERRASADGGSRNQLIIKEVSRDSQPIREILVKAQPPKNMCNKMTMFRPSFKTKGLSCKPVMSGVEVQTDVSYPIQNLFCNTSKKSGASYTGHSESKASGIGQSTKIEKVYVPVPIPVPVPIFIPVPIPASIMQNNLANSSNCNHIKADVGGATVGGDDNSNTQKMANGSRAKTPDTDCLSSSTKRDKRKRNSSNVSVNQNISEKKSSMVTNHSSGNDITLDGNESHSSSLESTGRKRKRTNLESATIPTAAAKKAYVNSDSANDTSVIDVNGHSNNNGSNEKVVNRRLSGRNHSGSMKSAVDEADRQNLVNTMVTEESLVRRQVRKMTAGRYKC